MAQTDVAAILSLSAPSPEALRRLEAALEQQDRPAEAVNWFLQQRALYVDTFWSRYYGTDPDELTIDRASRVAVAVERYRRDHDGRLPGTLADLVPAYLANVPADPATGGPLIYRRTADAYVIYGAGSNRKDDAGILRERPAARAAGDAGVRVLIR